MHAWRAAGPGGCRAAMAGTPGMAGVGDAAGDARRPAGTLPGGLRGGARRGANGRDCESALTPVISAHSFPRRCSLKWNEIIKIK